MGKQRLEVIGCSGILFPIDGVHKRCNCSRSGGRLANVAYIREAPDGVFQFVIDHQQHPSAPCGVSNLTITTSRCRFTSS